MMSLREIIDWMRGRRSVSQTNLDWNETADAIETMSDEMEQLRAFRAGSYKSARDILAASMNIGGRHDDETFRLAVAEIDAIAENLERFHAGYLDEVGILNERLTRRFDPALAWNEAINRACEAKKIAKSEMLTEFQQRAFDVQQRTTKDALRNA
jgi:hypothetical protein